MASDILWSIAHEQGIALPVKDYWEFDRLVTVSDPRGVPDLDALDAIYHWTELIQSSPLAVERSVHGAIGGAYRSQGITTLELRFNPMKRNRGGERDLDHIILAAIRGLDRASLEYPQVRAGLILMMDRTFATRQNRDHRREGDPLGAARHRRDRHRRPAPGRRALRLHGDAPIVDTRATAGLGVTIHVGEEGGEFGARRDRRGDRGRCAPTASATGSWPPATRELMRALRETGDRAGDLPDVEPADEGAGRRGRDPRHVPRVRREGVRIHDRHGRPGDDANAPARRARVAAPLSARWTQEELAEATARGHDGELHRRSPHTVRSV